MALPPGYADSIHEYPNHAAQLLEHFAELRKESRLHDIILKLADGEWRAHKCVLSAFSGFFRTLFMGSASRDKEVKLKTVTCKGIGPLLEYMYTGRLELVEENVMEVFCTAGYLQVFNVLSDISTFLSSTTLSTQQKGYGDNSIFDINNDCSEETYNHGVCDVMNVQHDSRSESPDSGTQSGEEFRTDEETAPLSGNSLNMLAAEMTADASGQFSSAFAQVLSMDMQINQQNVMPVTQTPVTIVDANGLPSMVNQQNLMSVTQTPVTIVDTNGLPSMVILEQGQVDQSGVVAQEQESSVGEQDRSMGEEMHSTEALEQLVHLNTQGYPETPLEEAFDSFSSTQEQPDENEGCALPEESANVDSEQAPCSNSTSGMDSTICMALPISDVGTAEAKSLLVTSGENDTEEDESVIVDVEQDTSTTAMLNNSNASLAKTRTSDNIGEQPVVEQGKVQVIQGEDTPVEEVLRDDSLTMQTGDVLSEPGTEGKSSVPHVPMVTNDNNETNQAVPSVPVKNMGDKKNSRRKTSRAAAQRGWKSKFDPYSCSICGEEFQTNRKLQNHMTKVHAGQTEPERVDRVSSVTMQTEASQEAGIEGCKKKKKKRKKKSAVVNEPRAIGYTNDGTAEFQTLQESEMEPKGKTARFDHITLEMLTKRRRKLKNDPYVCRICGEELQSSGKLRTHMANHEGGKKYECPICAAKFGYSNHLADHMRIHTGERPHKCKQCDANFKQRSTLIRHERRHTGIMPYRCAVCNRGFHDTTHLKMHLKTHAAKEDKVQEEDFGVALLQKVCESQELS